MNKARMLLHFLLMGTLVSCSSVQKTVDKILGRDKKVAPKVVKKKVNYGPTLTNSLLYRDRTKKYGLDGVKGVRFYAVDLNADGHNDLVVLPDFFSVPNFYFFNKKRKRFIKSNRRILPKNTQTSFLKFIDLNNDGVLDLLAGTLNQKTELTKRPLRIFRGRLRRGVYTLTEVKSAFNAKDLKKLSELPVASASFVDYNMDGKLDIYVGTWFKYSREGEAQIIPDYFYVGNRFKFFNNSGVLHREFDATDDASNIYTNAKPTFGTSTCDVDQNGYPDILTASSGGHYNKMWLNLIHPKRKDRFFKDHGRISGYSSDEEGRAFLTGGGNTFFSSCADYNNDGIMDVYVGELFYSYDNEDVDRSSVLTGKQKRFPPKFIRTNYTNDQLDNWSQGDQRAIWFDYNNDGLMDLLVDNSGFPPYSRLVLFEQQFDHAYEEVSIKAGLDIVNPTGSVVLDINNDGRLDIITGQSNIRDSNIPGRIYVFENRTARDGNRSLRFYLKGQKSNRNAQGAMVILRTNLGIKRQWIDFSQGPQASQNEMVVHFGLRDGERPRSVRVQWPYRNKRGQIAKTYKLSKYKFKRYLPLTLCESGKAHYGQNKRCR